MFSNYCLSIVIVISFLSDPSFILSQEEYFPLHKGNQWSYHYHSEDLNHNTIDTMFTISVIDTTSGYSLFDRYFLYISSLVGGDSSFFKMNGGKAMRYVNSKDMTWYDFTATVGDTWIIPVRYFLFGDTIDVVAELKSKTETFVLGQDTLKNCYRFSFQFTKMIPDMFPWEELFAPNIGLVKSESGSIFWEYHSFTLKEGIINGLLVSVSHRNEEKLPLRNFFLKQNYPNPFNSATKIKYGISAGAFTKTSLKIYNVRGQKIRTLIDKTQPPGIYELIWDGKDDMQNIIPSGIYLYIITVDGDPIVKKLIFIK